MSLEPSNSFPERGPRRAAFIVMERLEGGLGRLEGLVAVIALSIILAAILAGIATRVLNLHLPNYGEFAIAAMAPLTFVGAALCSYLHRHITIDVAEGLSSPGVRRVIQLASAGVMLVFAAYLAWLTWDFFLYARSSGERLIDVGTPIWIPIGFILSGAILMMVHAACDLLRLVLGLPRSGASR